MINAQHIDCHVSCHYVQDTVVYFEILSRVFFVAFLYYAFQEGTFKIIYFWPPSEM